MALQSFHTLIAGSSGTGKTTKALELMLDAINEGDGVFFIDPHGHDSEALIGLIPKSERKRVIYVDFADTEHPIPINPLANIPPDQWDFAAARITDSLKDAAQLGAANTPIMTDVLYNTAYCCIAASQSFMCMRYFMTNTPYRERILEQVPEDAVRDYWLREFAKLSDRDKRMEVNSARTKVTPFINYRPLARVFAPERSAFTFKQVLDDRMILIARIPLGVLGVEKVKFLIVFLLTDFYATVQSVKHTSPFHVVLDEAYLARSQTLDLMLSGVRKYNVSLTLIAQYFAQFDEQLLASILANTKRKWIFRLGLEDSLFMQRSVPLNNTRVEPHELANFQYWEIVNSTLTHNNYQEPLPEPDPREAQKTIAYCRNRYAADPAEIDRFMQSFIRKTWPTPKRKRKDA